MRLPAILYYLFIGIVVSAGLYVGIGGMGRAQYKLEYQDLLSRKPAPDDNIPVTAKGLTFKNQLERMRFDKADESDRFNSIFVGIDAIPDLIALILTACSFSMLGAVTNLVYLLFIGKRERSFRALAGSMILGALTGLFVVGLTYIIPTALVKLDDAQIRPISLMFTSLFAGFSFVRFYEKVSKYFEKIVGNKSKEEE